MSKELEIKDNPQIGKDVIESLTLGMYEDCRFIYREYIQNAADQIDKAIAMGLIEDGKDEIYVTIDEQNRKIVIEDNATGVPQDKVVPILRNIAHSTKKRGIDKGFRGIGRLGGLGYCEKLRFETSYPGEPSKSTMVWDAALLKRIINDRNTTEEAVDVLRQVTRTEVSLEESDAHYFRVVMEGVTTSMLLNKNCVRDYLSMVAPVAISSSFIFRSKIQNFMETHNLKVDNYNIFINGEQIYKPYTSCIYEENNCNKKKTDDIKDIDFLLQTDANGELLYWGWYSISRLNGQMKQINLARGIRLRKENIQIGDEEICKKFFDKTDDHRFSFYFFGEIHAVSKDLIPNSRRDYFGENDTCGEFERKIKVDFLKLKDLCYGAQKIRSQVKTIEKYEEFKNKIEEKRKTGFTSKNEEASLTQQLEEHKQKEAEARKKLDNLSSKYGNTEGPLKGIFESLTAPVKNKPEIPVNPKPTKAISGYKDDHTFRFRTDKPCYSQYDKHEKRLIGRIYTSIENIIPDEVQREAIISKIEEDLTK